MNMAAGACANPGKHVEVAPARDRDSSVDRNDIRRDDDHSAEKQYLQYDDADIDDDDESNKNRYKDKVNNLPPRRPERTLEEHRLGSLLQWERLRRPTFSAGDTMGTSNAIHCGTPPNPGQFDDADNDRREGASNVDWPRDDGSCNIDDDVDDESCSSLVF